MLAMFRQGHWMKENVRIADNTAKAAKESAEAAQKSAEAATATIKIMKRTARRQLRARVFVVTAQRLEQCLPRRFTAELTIKNFGGVPAYGCTFRAHMSLMTNPLGGAEIPKLHVSGQEANLVLPPGAEVRTRLYLPQGGFEQNQHNLVTAGSYAVYIHGEIHYRDGFGKHCASTFLMRCGGLEYATGRFSFCERGNTAN